MPDPSVEPSPPLAEEFRFVVPLEAQDASYFAASDKTASRSLIDFLMQCSLYVLMRFVNFHIGNGSKTSQNMSPSNLLAI
ncbi:hypothetical protein D3C80_1763460 [compost metagenome]